MKCAPTPPELIYFYFYILQCFHFQFNIVKIWIPVKNHIMRVKTWFSTWRSFHLQFLVTYVGF